MTNELMSLSGAEIKQIGNLATSLISVVDTLKAKRKVTKAQLQALDYQLAQFKAAQYSIAMKNIFEMNCMQLQLASDFVNRYEQLYNDDPVLCEACTKQFEVFSGLLIKSLEACGRELSPWN